MDYNKNDEIIVERPQVLECDVVRFQNNKEKWVARTSIRLWMFWQKKDL